MPLLHWSLFLTYETLLPLTCGFWRALENGVAKDELIEIITHFAFHPDRSGSPPALGRGYWAGVSFIPSEGRNCFPEESGW